MSENPSFPPLPSSTTLTSSTHLDICFTTITKTKRLSGKKLSRCRRTEEKPTVPTKTHGDEYPKVVRLGENLNPRPQLLSSSSSSSPMTSGTRSHPNLRTRSGYDATTTMEKANEGTIPFLAIERQHGQGRKGSGRVGTVWTKK